MKSKLVFRHMQNRCRKLPEIGFCRFPGLLFEMGQDLNTRFFSRAAHHQREMAKMIIIEKRKVRRPYMDELFQEGCCRRFSGRQYDLFM
ncbi:hypothetical protein [Rhizobium sp. BE258]|uniref:hypothetical protein n=1 Tax=Rhizobium sp. BE258 TaxID=2817722 RepID=UPI002858DCB9|nr:hypothetical protein [Rhizobium sp. BE258]MDR7145323.1 hypothetical protein [Rhizobium sp. BE258]